MFEAWKVQAQVQFWEWKRRNLKTNKIETIIVQGSLRPSVLGTWEYVFPEECLPNVLAVFGLIEDNEGRTLEKIVLRKMIGAKKIPKKVYEEAKKINPSILIPKQKRGVSSCIIPGVLLHVIGIKKDIRMESKQFGYEQEML